MGPLCLNDTINAKFKGNYLYMRYLLVLMAMYIALPSMAQNEYVPPYPPAQLKILSWNIHMLPYCVYYKTQKNKRSKGIVEELGKRDYNILVFQEAFKMRSRRKVYKGLKEKYPYRYGPANRKFFSIKTNSGIWVLSDRPLSIKGEVTFTECANDGCLARKGGLMVEGEHNGHIFQIVGTHTNGNPQEVNRHQFRQLYDELLKPHQDSATVQIICSDMNCQRQKPEDYEAMMRLLHVTQQPHFNCREDTASTNEIEHTVDYIFVRDNGANINIMRTATIRIGPSWKSGNPKRYGTTVGLSDHYAVEMIMEWKD